MEMVTDLTMAALAGARIITVFSRHNLLITGYTAEPVFCILIKKPGFCL